MSDAYTIKFMIILIVYYRKYTCFSTVTILFDSYDWEMEAESW